MPRTIQCQKCGVVLNLPPHVNVGKRLKCPRCTTRFVVTEADASSVSTLAGTTDAALTSFDLEKMPPNLDDLPAATSTGDLRDTFDLPLVSGREVERGEAVSGSATADASALFADTGAARRRQTAAEARARARRCSHCGGGVPAGMSICPTCGTDQETGMRVGLEDDFAPAAPPRPGGPPLHVAIIGGICGTAGIILALTSVIQSTRGTSSVEHYFWLSLAILSVFGIYACVQFIRGRSARPLMLALGLGVAFNLVGLVAYPLIEPMLRDPDQVIKHDIKPEDPGDAAILILPFEERINSERIATGVGILILYAVLSLYLISPPVKKFLFRSRGDHGL